MAKDTGESSPRTTIEKHLRIYELHSLLFEVDERGFVALPMNKLLRLLGRGNKATRTWRELLDEWETLGYERDGLHVYMTEWQGTVVLTKGATKLANQMAGE